MAETFDWLKPSALWDPAGLDFHHGDFFQPQILGFQTDSFMEEFMVAVSAAKPDLLQSCLVKPSQASSSLKLYQPNHGCFYLTCSSLCCHIPGLPDRRVRSAEGENVFFVLRKIDSTGEYAWLADDQNKGWQPLANKMPLPTEERLPLMTMHGGNGRTIVFGYLPVASRETYNVPATALVEPSRPDMRVEELNTGFSNPLKVISAGPSPAQVPTVFASSVYLLLDLWEYLSTYVPPVAQTLQGTSTSLDDAERDLLTFLTSQELNGGLTLASALGAVASHRDALNQAGGSDDELQTRLDQLGFDGSYSLTGVTVDTDALEQKVQATLPPLSPSNTPPFQLPKLDPHSGSSYVVRCVYERPQCAVPVRVVSAPSQTFQFAPFYDPDAPGRPVRIALPADVSIAGMRKFNKNVTFLMSDAMRRKVNSITGHEKDLISNSPSVGSDHSSPDVAFICSFSIQIIFIVAFFLLLMFVIIFNFVFWWIAFFKICLPVPKKLLPGG